MSAADPPTGSRFPAEHRALDDLLGRFLAVVSAGDTDAAREAILAFDEALRRHTAAEEKEVFGRGPGEKLIPAREEGDKERTLRELALEHVQIRELSGILVRLLTEEKDLPRARSLLPSLLSRWDSHTAREEREVFSGDARGEEN